jgi:hypothetical protein
LARYPLEQVQFRIWCMTSFLWVFKGRDFFLGIFLMNGGLCYFRH